MIYGKDLTHIDMPVEFHEPLSVLQMHVEMIMMQKHMFEKATEEPESLVRLAQVTAGLIG